MEEIFKLLQSLQNRIKGLERQLSAPTLTWTAPTFTNSWVDFGSVYQTAGYTRDQRNFVLLRGLVKSGTVNTAMFTLPAGYRPTNRRIFVTITDTGIGRLDVQSDGTVTLISGGNGFTSLENIAFYAEA